MKNTMFHLRCEKKQHNVKLRGEEVCDVCDLVLIWFYHILCFAFGIVIRDCLLGTTRRLASGIFASKISITPKWSNFYIRYFIHGSSSLVEQVRASSECVFCLVFSFDFARRHAQNELQQRHKLRLNKSLVTHKILLWFNLLPIWASESIENR